MMNVSVSVDHELAPGHLTQVTLDLVADVSRQGDSPAIAIDVRARLLKRTRDYIRNGFPVLEAWMNSQDGLFSYTPPDASAVSFIRYHMDINSTELMEKLCREASVFVGAGDSFGMDHHLRIAFGQEKETLEEAFSRIEKVLKSLA